MRPKRLDLPSRRVTKGHTTTDLLSPVHVM